MTKIMEKIRSFFKKKTAAKADKPAQPADERKPEPQKGPAQAEKPKV